MIKFFKWMGVISFIFLAGCPAPSDSNKDSILGATLEPGVSLIMSISSTGEKTNKIPTNDDAKVEMIFLDTAKVPLSGKIINILATSGTLSQASVLTDLEGRATVTINPPTLTTGTAPGIFTATPEAVSADDDATEEEKELIEKMNQPVTMNYEFVATTVADTPDDAAKFVSSLQFINASPTFLSLKGTGGVGYGEISNLIFKVVDSENSPIAGVQVDFTLTTSVGGLALSVENSLSNDQGEAYVNVLAGTISTPVRVTASVRTNDGSLLSVQSDLLTITTGIPDNNSFSLGVVGKFAPEGANFNGDTVELVVQLADRNNNPVPDGTVVNFTTEGGVIGGSCETVVGSCSVTWASQNPRPLDHRSTILAYAIGHETFSDRNGSGIFDDGDVFIDQGEAFRDDDEMGTYNPGEISFSWDEKLIDYDESGDYTAGDGLYNGVPCNHSTACPDDANNIAGRSNLLVNLQKETTLIMAASNPRVHMYELLSGYGSCLDENNKLALGLQCQEVSSSFAPGPDTKQIWVLIEDTAAFCRDLSGNRIDGVVDPNSVECINPLRQSAPTGSSISVKTEVGTLTTTPSVVPNQLSAFTFTFMVTASSENEEVVGGALEVVVTTPVTSNIVTRSASLVDPIN
ncbi:Invasin domain protein [hydrothermal vent metagenome]|uniref:Invasin domain protein n=1 Tax=hydrothermal vent metagenome TaxID=652676 RepID=A0A3B0WJV1_9ZZZZ